MGDQDHAAGQPSAERIPPAIRPLLEQYRAGLTALPIHICGVYVYGS